MKLRIRTLSVAMALVSLGGCKRDQDPPVVTVGDYVLTKKMIDARQQVVKIYYPTAEDKAGQQQLIKTYTYAAILKKYDSPLNDELLKKEEERIDRDTKSPEMLNRIKQVFGADHELYVKVFIFPNLAEQKMTWDFFPNHSPVQKTKREEVQSLLDKLKSHPQDFEKFAEEKKFTLLRLELTPGKPLKWINPKIKMPKEEEDKSAGLIDASTKSEEELKVREALKKQAELNEQDEASHWYLNVVKPTREGQLFTQLIENQESYQIGKVIQGKKAPYIVAIINIPRPDMFQWLEEESKSIPVVWERQ